MIGPVEIMRVAAEIGSPVTLEDATAAVNSVDVEGVLDAQIKDYRMELWDRKSPIHGVPADTILASRRDIPDKGHVYLLYKGDRLLYFQPHNPEQAGHEPMTKAQAMKLAKQHIEQLAEDDARPVLIEAMVEEALRRAAQRGLR